MMNTIERRVTVFNRKSNIENRQLIMLVKIRGKEYLTVAERVSMIHADLPGKVSIETEIVEHVRVEGKPAEVVMKATVTIAGENGTQTFVGHAHEKEDLVNKKSVNATSYLENGSTSAIGRALAASGRSGSEYASADELAQALTQAERFKADDALYRSAGDLKAERELREKLMESENDLNAAKRQITLLNERIQRAKSVYAEQQAEIRQMKGGQHTPPESQPSGWEGRPRAQAA